jgi:ribosomal protein S12 methylthiotransferase accessory factor
MKANVEIQNCYKTYSHDQDKTRSPKETIKWVRERIEKFNVKILSKTVRIDTGRLDIPVYLSLCADEATRYTGTKKQMGKGATPEQSEASALMELMERFSFFSFIHQHPFPYYRYGEVASRAVSPETLAYSLHDTETPIEACRAFLQDLPLRWVAAYNLTRKTEQLVPIDWFYLINEYNGPAAGNTLEEAILQALCEVVERHVGSIISFENRPTPVIDPESLRDPASLELLRKFKRHDLQVFLRDFSLDTGIPTVGALVYDPSTFPEKSEIVFTAGTTSNPEKSLCRALTEIAQLAGDFESRTSYRPTLPKYATLEEAGYLMENGKTVPISSLPNLDHDNIRVEIERCVEALERIGMEVLVVNTTHAELGVPAVYTIIPGAHFLDHTRNTDFPQHAARTILRSLAPHQGIQHLEQLIDIFGPRYDLTFFLAHSLELEGRSDAALQLFKQSLNQGPAPGEVASIYVHMASCYKDLGQYNQALESLELAEQFNNELKEIYNLRGFCFYQLKEHNKAISAFEKAIEIDPGSGIDYANIGSNLRELGFKEEAIRLYRIALDIDPDIDFARENIAKLEAELNNAANQL